VHSGIGHRNIARSLPIAKRVHDLAVERRAIPIEALRSRSRHQVGESMTSAENPVLTRTSTLRSRIAWLSVWIVAAGEQLARLGSLGLAAALGWEVTKRTRWLLKKSLQQNATTRPIARTEADAAAQIDSLSEIGGLELGSSRTADCETVIPCPIAARTSSTMRNNAQPWCVCAEASELNRCALPTPMRVNL
jgi:hypothetical protein